MIMGVGLGLGSRLFTGFIPELYISWSPLNDHWLMSWIEHIFQTLIFRSTCLGFLLNWYASRCQNRSLQIAEYKAPSIKAKSYRHISWSITFYIHHVHGGYQAFGALGAETIWELIPKWWSNWAPVTVYKWPSRTTIFINKWMLKPIEYSWYCSINTDPNMQILFPRVLHRVKT